MATVVLESRTANTQPPQWENRDVLPNPSYFPLGIAQVNNPAHPNRTEDSVAAFSVANGEGFALVVADGMSSGGEASKVAADFITEELQKQFRYCRYLPSVEQVDETIIRALYTASAKTFNQLVKPTYESLVGSFGDELAKVEANNIGSTVCAAVRCLDENEEPAVRIAARGDSSCYAFDVVSGQLELVFPNEAMLNSHNDGLVDWVCNYYVEEMKVEGKRGGKKKGLFTYKPEGGDKLLFTVTDGFYLLPDEAQQFFVQVAFREAFDATGGLPAQTGERFMHIFAKSLMAKCAEYIAGFEGAPDDGPPGDDISIAAAYIPDKDSQQLPIWERRTAIYELPPPLEEVATWRVLSVGEITLADEMHPTYCADSVAAGHFGDGQGGFVVVADGIGKGGKFSVEPAQIVTIEAQSRLSQLTGMLTLQEGKTLLQDIFMKAAQKIVALQERYLGNATYNGNAEIMKQIQIMGAAASIGLTCVDEDGNTVLLCANRGDCEIRIIDADRLDQPQESSQPAVRTVTRPDAEGNKLTRSVRPIWVDKMREFMGEGFSTIPLPEHPIILAMSDGWGKVVVPERQEEALRDYFAFAQEERETDKMQAFAECFAYEAQTAWESSILVPRDDISAAAIELVLPVHNARRSFS